MYQEARHPAIRGNRAGKRIRRASGSNHEEAARLVLLVVGAQMRTSRRALLLPSRGPAHTSMARQVAMYLLHTMLSCPYQEVAAIFGRDRTTVSHACRQVEDMRDDADFDLRIAAMEEIIEAALALRAAPVFDSRDTRA